MHPFVPHTPNPMHVATHAERLAKEQQGNKLGLVFAAITAVSMGVMTTKLLLDMLRDRDCRHNCHGSGKRR
jgi:hypothetical protein